MNVSLGAPPHPGVADRPRRAGAWPLESHLELGAYPTAIPCARLHARLVVTEWGLEAFADAAELVVSELVTNAVQAADGLMRSTYDGQRRAGLPPVRLWLQSDHRCLVVLVWDGSDQMPRRVAPDQESQGGRGLWLVEARSEDWGMFKREHTSGKVVWAKITRG